MPAAKQITLTIDTATAKRVIASLRQTARTAAGHSQAPDLVYHTEIQEWHDAKAIAAQLRDERNSRVGT